MTVLHHLYQVSVGYRCTLFVSLSLQVTVHMTSSQLMPSTLSLRMNPWHICMTVLPALLQPEKFCVSTSHHNTTSAYLLKRPGNKLMITIMLDSTLMLSTQTQDISLSKKSVCPVTNSAQSSSLSCYI